MIDIQLILEAGENIGKLYTLYLMYLPYENKTHREQKIKEGIHIDIPIGVIINEELNYLDKTGERMIAGKTISPKMWYKELDERKELMLEMLMENAKQKRFTKSYSGDEG